MNINLLHSFCAAYELGSLSKAAKKIGISTATMTRHVQQVEAYLAAPLFHRSTAGLTPTAPGDLYYDEAIEILEKFEHSLSVIKQSESQVKGILKIGVPASISHLWIAPTIYQLKQAYPELDIRLVIGNHLMDLLSQRFDVIIHCGPLKHVDYYFQKIGTWDKITCASPDFLKRFGEPKHPKDLKHTNCLDHFDWPSHDWRYTIDAKEKDIVIKGNVQANSSMDLKALAISGLGLVYLPSFTVQDALDNGLLIEVLKEYRPTPFDMFAVYSIKKKHSQKIKACIDYFIKTLPNNGKN